MKTNAPFLRLGLLSVSIATIFLLSACNAPVRMTEPSEWEGERDYVQMDRTLQGQVVIKDVNRSKVSDNLLQVQAEVQNTSRRMTRFNYAFEWFNEDGILITSPPVTWKTRQIEGNESIFLTAVAPHAEAKDFRLKVMRPVSRN
ncbi:MAG: YcfL family protein [Opitutales bacterium]|nr:YcfL family protein [Opitutales bacterium]MCH8540163.1 YcfL family protein [Opitutales bacterium]